LDHESSRHESFIEPIPKAAPGVLGFGSSAFLNRKRGNLDAKQSQQQSYVLSPSSFSSLDWSVSLWIFLLPYPMDSFISVLHKGDKENPILSVLIWPSTPRIRVKFGTTSVDTISAITVGRWTQITIVKEGGIGSVYVNGLLDSQIILGKAHSHKDTAEELYLSGSPWHRGLHGYIDQLRLYNRALTADEARATASFAFPALLGGSALPSLACYRCSLQRAMTLCGARTGSHLCSIHELRSYALLVGRLLGWINLHHTNHPGEPPVYLNVWSHEEGALLHKLVNQENSTQTQTSSIPENSAHVGYGLCCPDHPT